VTGFPPAPAGPTELHIVAEDHLRQAVNNLGVARDLAASDDVEVEPDDYLAFALVEALIALGSAVLLADYKP
jgi:hypothetical protein